MWRLYYRYFPKAIPAGERRALNSRDDANKSTAADQLSAFNFKMRPRTGSAGSLASLGSLHTSAESTKLVQDGEAHARPVAVSHNATARHRHSSGFLFSAVDIDSYALMTDDPVTNSYPKSA